MALNIKEAVDSYFEDNWTSTPVQYEGTDFGTPVTHKWISLQMLPYDRDTYAYDGANGRKRSYQLIRVRCYDVSPTLAFTLAQEVQAFFECVTLDTLKVGIGTGDGNGAVDLNNDIYEVTLNFDTIDYE